MMYDIIYEACPWHTRCSLLDEDGRLISLHYDDTSFTYSIGTITLGIVRKVVPALNAAFVDIGDTMDGFLSLNSLEEGKALHEGEKVVTRITRKKTAEKGATLNAQVLYDAESAMHLKAPQILQEGPCALSRALMSAGLTPVKVWIHDERFREDVEQLVDKSRVFLISEHSDVDIIGTLDEQIEDLHTPTFNIPGGGRITIEMTKALTAIDVDSGAMTTSFKGKPEELPLQVNKAAAKEIIRLSHVLNIGGSIIVDFITLPTRQDRKELQKFLEESFANRIDRKVDVLKISRYGIVELNIEKIGENLLEKLSLPVYEAGEILLKIWRTANHKTPIMVETDELVADIIKKRLTTQAAMSLLGVAVTVRTTA